MGAALDVAYDRLVAVDEAIFKAAKLSEVARIAKLEQRLREYVDARWNAQSVKAAGAAASATKAGRSAKQISAAVRKAMKPWEAPVAKRMNRDTAAYRLAKTAGHKKASGKTKASLQYDTPNLTDQVEKARRKRPRGTADASFGLADEEAIKALAESNTFWVGRHYDENVSRAVSEVAADALATGASRSAAAVTMRERIVEALASTSSAGGFHGSSTQYFEGLVANAMTVARTQGQLRSFVDLGVEKYVIVNPLDERAD